MKKLSLLRTWDRAASYSEAGQRLQDQIPKTKSKKMRRALMLLADVLHDEAERLVPLEE